MGEAGTRKKRKKKLGSGSGLPWPLRAGVSAGARLNTDVSRDVTTAMQHSASQTI